ncbi:Ubiquitin-like protein [Glarea lozoyensis ATCC 20868]|uniref:Ubiquitin-like protein n=1 Tax=Glarea lozoyensis (strain ATCC 20868 / MF5171) TaxID=1116229 RepID=S3CUE2_GLAL2|nr:Ubiquitin-like protein [Glarea lozoyensis ATCC 20868]EPE29250.1 Ubiquitin-like protein [Glarea lozoyensis ATCC 20868]
MDDAVETFKMVTGAIDPVARRYLEMTENDAQQAIALFFDSPDLASGVDQAASSSAPPIPSASRPRGVNHNESQSASRTIDLDDDDDEDDLPEFDENEHAAALGRAADLEDDEAMARRMQEEMYAGGDAAGGLGGDDVRAPIARTTETLVGGSDGPWGHEDMEAAIAQQMRMRQNRSAPRAGVFNQRAVSSIWDESADPATRREGLSQATGGASDSSSKTARLAELYRPPFEIMRQMSWDAARELGKEEEKWILVNIQDASIFDCQQLNRDIWKDQGIKEVVKENFLFMQFNKDDTRGATYIQYYFQASDSQSAYPHIAIVDPRTGEQVKVWSGPPVPKAPDFLMQLIEFLDRYSLDLSKKNPVARRKEEKPKAVDVDRLTEDEMLDLALQNSLGSGAASGPKENDPDELTKSFGDLSKGKGRATDEDTELEATGNDTETIVPNTYSKISSSNAHTEPDPGPDVTRIQFRHSNGRVVRKFKITDPVERLFEWLKAEPLDGKVGVPFDLRAMPAGKDLGEQLNETIDSAGLKMGTIMVEYLED